MNEKDSKDFKKYDKIGDLEFKESSKGIYVINGESVPQGEFEKMRQAAVLAKNSDLEFDKPKTINGVKFTITSDDDYLVNGAKQNK